MTSRSCRGDGPEVMMSETGRRRAKVFVPMETIAKAVKLPDDVLPVFVYVCSDPPGAYMIVESDAFPEQDPACELPVILNASWTVHPVEVGGQTAHRVEVTATAEEIGASLRQRSGVSS